MTLQPDRLPRDLGRGISGLRVALGAVMLLRPALLPRVLGVDRITARRVGWLTRMVGGREVALGAGGLLAGDHLAAWVLAQAAGDLGDVAALVAAARAGTIRRLPGGVTAASALAGALAGLAAARALR